MLRSLLIANRGEIAIRIARTASDLGVVTTAIHSEDDAGSLHIRHADRAVNLEATGVAAYLDAAAIIAVAQEQGCEAIHPGYGFLSEASEFGAACEQAGLIFVGPRPETLQRFGNKAQARALAEECSVPVLSGLNHAVTFDECCAFLEGLGADGAAMLKAVAGG